MTAEDLVRDLVNDCSESERMRLLAWANAPRAIEIQQAILKQKKLGGGPSRSPEVLAMTMAVGQSGSV